MALNALSCSSTPSDMFVSHDGVVYFIENNHIKKINNVGHVEFITGRSKKENELTASNLYQAGLISEVVNNLGKITVIDPLNLDIINIKPSSTEPIYNVIGINEGGDYSTANKSANYACNSDGMVCELVPGGDCMQVVSEEGSLVDKVVFPKQSDYLFLSDKEKLSESNNNIYLNTWKCIGSDIYEINDKLYVPYFHYGSGGVMQLDLN